MTVVQDSDELEEWWRYILFSLVVFVWRSTMDPVENVVTEVAIEFTESPIKKAQSIF